MTIDSYGHKKYQYFTQEEKIKHRERVWAYKIRREYGITSQDYYSMLEDQNGLCAICEVNITDQKLCVDHNHKTGRIRGLLCRNCNLKLQIFEDEQFMNKAFTYIKIRDLKDKEPLG